MRYLQERFQEEYGEDFKTFEGFFPPILKRRLHPEYNTLRPTTALRITKKLMRKSEKIDILYTPGDLRAAVATKCYYGGVPTRAILDRGGWLCEKTFFQWYRKITDENPQEIDSDLSVECAIRRRKHSTT